MKLDNQTHYETSPLRSILCEVHRRLALAEGKLQTWEHLRVTVVYHRGASWVGGHASLSGYRMTLKLPRLQGNAQTLKVAYIMEHELFHNYGYRHRQMQRGWPTPDQLIERYGWAKEMVGELLPIREVVPKVKQDIQTIRYERVLAGLKRWATKLRRAQTAIKTLNTKRRYYEHALTAAGKLPEKE